MCFCVLPGTPTDNRVFRRPVDPSPVVSHHCPLLSMALTQADSPAPCAAVFFFFFFFFFFGGGGGVGGSTGNEMQYMGGSN
jgi:hypothetical protein